MPVLVWPRLRVNWATTMHVFIDTNIFLNFFHFTKEELDALNNVFASHEHGAATVHLTQQVVDEFRRNREGKIQDALKRFSEAKFNIQLPSFMKAYDEYEDIRGLAKTLQEKTNAILTKANDDISKKALLADQLIKDIIAKSAVIETTEEIFRRADMRMRIGNPPGKKNSLGDAINWIVLLDTVPDGEDLHLISEDGDFFSNLNENNAHPFLEEEWNTKKKSGFRVYRTLSSFLAEHFDGVAFSFDKKKEALIDDLHHSGSFAKTHDLVSELESYGYFSKKETERILEAAVINGQFGWIVGDPDVSDFLNRIAVPRKAELTKPEHLAIIDGVIQKQAQKAQAQ